MDEFAENSWKHLVKRFSYKHFRHLANNSLWHLAWFNWISITASWASILLQNNPLHVTPLNSYSQTDENMLLYIELVLNLTQTQTCRDRNLFIHCFYSWMDFLCTTSRMRPIRTYCTHVNMPVWDTSWKICIVLFLIRDPHAIPSAWIWTGALLVTWHFNWGSCWPGAHHIGYSFRCWNGVHLLKHILLITCSILHQKH